MPRKSDVGDEETTTYLTRNLRVDLLERMRMLAIKWGANVEEVHNIVVAAGLVLLEKGKPHGKG